jgi:hypothetical protein
VSLSGSNSNAGTITAPLRTVEKAFSVATSGTTIYVRGGTYPDSVQIYNRTYSVSNPVTVTNYPGEKPMFVGDGKVDMFYFQNDQGIRVRGLDLSNQASVGIAVKVYESQHIDLDDLFVHDNGTTKGDGILVSGDGQTPADRYPYCFDVQIWNSVFTRNGKDPISDHSVYFAGGTLPGGIPNANNVIANNVIYDQLNGAALHIGANADGIYIVNNTIYHTTSTDPYMGQAITIWNDSNDGDETKNLKVYNNLLVNNKVGVSGSGWVSMPSNFVDYNYAFGTVGVWGCGDCNFDPRFGNSGVQLYTAGTHNIVGPDPRFVNAAGHDFHLQAGSAALGKANPAYAPALDADGNPRPAAPAMGAFG